MKIETNVPLPSKNKGVKGKWDFITEMQIGDSFFVDDNHKTRAARFAFRYRGLKCTTKKVKDGYRIWRIA